MGTFNSGIFPTSPGLQLGKTGQEWQVNATTVSTTGNETVGGNLTVAGTASFKNSSAVRDATQFTGADIGAQINAAYADLPATGGTILVPPKSDGSSYSFSTPILLNTINKYCVLQGGAPSTGNNGGPGGSTLLYTPTTATSAITLDWTPVSGGGYACGAGMRDITLVNNLSPVNGGSGSSAIGVNCGPSNGGVERAIFMNCKIGGFGTGMKVAESTGVGWGIHWLNCSFVWNTTGLNIAVLHENDSCTNCVFAVNGTGISLAAGAELSIFGGSMDSNTVAGIAMNGNALAHIFGVHWENLNTTNVHYITGGAATNVDITGGLALDDTATSSTDFWFQFGIGSVRGLTLFSAGRTVTNLFNIGSYADVSVINNSPAVLTGSLGVQFAGSNSIFKQVASGVAPTILSKQYQLQGTGSGTATLVAAGSAGGTHTFPNNTGTVAELNLAQTWTAAQSFGSGDILPSAAGGTDLGSAALPFGNIWLGTAATNNFKFQPAATAAARTLSMPDPLGNVNMPYVIASGTSTMASGSIAAATCATAITTAATGVVSTDSIEWAYATAPTLTTDALLHISPYVTAGNVNFTRCNPTAGAIVGTAIVINWRVIR